MRRSRSIVKRSLIQTVAGHDAVLSAYNPG
jgi:hypothetical protein